MPDTRFSTATKFVPSTEETTPDHQFVGAVVIDQLVPLSVEMAIAPRLPTVTSLVASAEQATRE